MSTEKASLSRFEYPEEDGYAPIDAVAVMAIICGLISSLAVLSAFFIGFGILGVIFGLSSLFRISRAEGTLSGFWVAVIGVALSTIFVASYVTYSSARDAAICSRARKYAEEWIEMIQDGQYLEAHQLTRSFFERQLPGTDLKKYYDPKMKLMDTVNPEASAPILNVAGTPYQQMEDFYAHPIMSVLRKEGSDCEVRFVQVLDRWRKGSFLDFVVLEYEIDYKDGGPDKKNLFAITMMREQYPGNFGTHWAVDMIDRKKTIADRSRKIED